MHTSESVDSTSESDEEVDMVRVTKEITKEEFEQAKKEGSDTIVPDYVKCGYGLYGSSVDEAEDGKFYLSWVQGSSCD